MEKPPFFTNSLRPELSPRKGVLQGVKTEICSRQDSARGQISLWRRQNGKIEVIFSLRPLRRHSGHALREIF
jgi:hypothetical protein